MGGGTLYHLHISKLDELMWILAYNGKGFNISQILKTFTFFLTLPKYVCIYTI